MGGVYAMLAVPFNFQIGALKVMNFSYGSLLMLGMYIVFVCLSNGFPVWGMLLVMLPSFFILGWLIRRYLVFTTDENVQILLTMGLSILIENLAHTIFGAFPRTLGSVEEGVGVMLGDSFVYVSLTRMYLAIGALVLLGAGYLFLQKSWYGRCIRALVQRPEMAAVMGVNVRATSCVAFAASFCYLAVAAYFFMFFLSVEPHTGHNFLSMCFLISVMGGIGNLMGSLLASFIIGVFSAFVAFFLPGYHDPIIFLMFIGVLLFKPNGLFGEA